MLVEYIRYQIAEDRRGEFEAAYRQAQAALAASPHCLAYELACCLQEPNVYTFRIEWDSFDGHLRGFRPSSESRAFFQAVRRFAADIEEVRYYAVTDVRSDQRGDGCCRQGRAGSVEHRQHKGFNNQAENSHRPMRQWERVRQWRAWSQAAQAARRCVARGYGPAIRRTCFGMCVERRSQDSDALAGGLGPGERPGASRGLLPGQGR